MDNHTGKFYEAADCSSKDYPDAQLNQFLAAFYPGPEEAIHLRTFPAKGDAGYSQNLVVSRTELLDKPERQKELLKTNDRQGSYFCPNSGGPTDSQIARYNAFFCENDDRPINEQYELMDLFPLPPSILVETLRSVHGYWLCVGECSEADWREIQAGLIKHFGSDERIKNPSRVMRLPYFDHISYDVEEKTYTRKPVQVVRFDPALAYSAEEMRRALSLSAPLQDKSQESQVPVSTSADLTVPSFANWSDLHAEVGRRIRRLAGAKLASDGIWIHANGVCHGGAGSKGLYLNLDSGKYKCFQGCDTATVLRALKLPDRPTSDVGDGPIGLLWGDLYDKEYSDSEKVIFELEPGEVGLLIATTNVGKTTLAMNVSLHLAAGGKFAPLVEAKAGGRRVMYVDGETRQSRFHWNMTRMLREWGPEKVKLVKANFYSLCDVILKDEQLNLANEEHLKRLTEEAIAFKPELIVLDTSSSLFAVQNENDNAEVGKRIMRPLNKLATQTNAAILLIHHIGKMNEDAQAGSTAYRGRGASAFGALPRLVLGLKQEPNSDNLVSLTCNKVKGRKFSPVVMQLDDSTRWFTATTATPSEKPSSYRQVVNTVRGFAREVERKEIDSALKDTLSKSQVGKHLRTAMDNGDLIRGKGGYSARDNAHVLDAIDNEEMSTLLNGAQYSQNGSVADAHLLIA